MVKALFSERLFKFLRKFVSPFVIIVIGFFIVKLLLSDVSGAKDAFLNIGWSNLAFAALFYFLCFYMRALTWNFVVDTFGYKLKLRDKLFSWFASEAARYVPGNVWSFVGKYYLSRKNGISKLHAVTAISLEVFILLTATFTLSLPALIVNYQKLSLNYSILIAIFIIALLLIVFFFFNEQINKIFKIFGKAPKRVFLSKKFLLAIFFMFFTWFCFGIGTYILIAPLADGGNMLIIISTCIFAWLVGYLSLITPTGLGVREEAIILLISGYTTHIEAGVVALTSRLLLISVESLNLLAWFLFYKAQKK
jgi:hypothetical protein